MPSGLIEYYYNILSKRDFTVSELTDKGLKRGFSGADVKEVLQRLIEQGLVNDERYASNLAQNYAGAKGPLWIKQKLLQHKFSLPVIEKVLSENELRPDNQLRLKLEKKYHVDNWSEVDQALKQKILNYLGRQGFSNSWEILKSWEQE
jgi:regulatory protein